MIDPVPGIDHHRLVRGGAEQEDVPAARHLEAEDLDVVGEADALYVGVEPVAGGVPERPAREQDGLEDLSRVLAETVEFLDDVVDVLEEREQELVLRRPDQPRTAWANRT
ncbi:hypothetical protein [Methanoculleus chikugoensis]|uniref:hypothetical protein n=1 Tax=Methanoculleus chikugoensis TaxID=118126 RepID=UPI001FB22EA4|nr:hypothetical protein [Methanoculleus chikugoensis]